MASFNKVILIGNFVADPELKQTPTGISVCRFRLAVQRRFVKDQQEQTADFIDIVAWRQTAEFITKYFTKGPRIGIEGSLRMNKFTDKDGNNRTTYEVVVNNAHFVENKRDGGNGGSYAPAAQQTAPASFSNSDSGDFTEIPTNDDLPF